MSQHVGPADSRNQVIANGAGVGSEEEGAAFLAALEA